MPPKANRRADVILSMIASLSKAESTCLIQKLVEIAALQAGGGEALEAYAMPETIKRSVFSFIFELQNQLLGNPGTSVSIQSTAAKRRARMAISAFMAGWETYQRMRRKPGTRVQAESDQIIKLRQDGHSWRVIGKQLKIDPETARMRAYRRRRRKKVGC